MNLENLRKIRNYSALFTFVVYVLNRLFFANGKAYSISLSLKTKMLINLELVICFSLIISIIVFVATEVKLLLSNEE